ncbi:MAG: 50S ribosomal protein L6 [Bacteroidetes bacterium]|jgi:large subunit ribosomal protein L6|nr:50S ribosomal protein L6 [Bacteroidota bacterium]MBT6684851.1 50S ribosomal protein L6 [Bacteroidota bacterium]MBT7142545.1 50S ribosomal protein L6 [Bacteroidota bacterium]MBT7493242.1 50S ribosomal protein L6 [Bacteroidota bacterium]
MSRIGKLPINIPEKVVVKIDKNNLVTIKGPIGELSQEVNPKMKIEIEDNILTIIRPSDEKEDKALHGLYRALINNMIIGVSKGYELKQEIVGVGYRAEFKNGILDLTLGYSHHIYFQLPKEIQCEATTERRSNTIITLKSHDKQLIGHVAAKIRSFRKPEPYKGKGIKFVGEELRKKAGKAAKV